MRRILLLCAVASAFCRAEPAVEAGEINGAQFRIDKPDEWNGGLIMYCHGYSGRPGTFSAEKPPALAAVFVKQGFAVAQSGYSTGGYAFKEGLEDTEALRAYFVRKYGPAKETWVMGHSMGGQITMALVETQPTSYDGGLALCGVLAPANWFLLRRAFDLIIVTNYLMPGALPSPAAVPPDFSSKPEVSAALIKLFEEKADQSATVRSISGVRTNKELATLLLFYNSILQELQKRAGGNPFDNRDTIYAGTADDNALNDGVPRHKADLKAAEYVRRFYTPSGRLSRPLLAVHTTYDPIVPPWVPNQYAVLAESAGNSDLFVQQYVKRDGHCAITPAETEHAFQELRRWKTAGERPAPGLRK